VFVLEDQKKVSLTCLAFSPDGLTLAAGGYRGVVRLWDLTAKRLSGSCSTGNWNNSALCFMPDDRGLLALVGGYLHLFDREGTDLGRRPRPNRRQFTASAASPDGRLCLGFSPLVLLSASGGLMEQALPDFAQRWKTRASGSGQVTALCYSADGRRLACGRGSGRVTVHDADTGAPLHEPREAGAEVKAVALSPDGRLVAWCAGTHLRLWRLDPPEQVREHSLGRTFFLSVAWHPTGGFFATANGDGKVDYWDAQSGERRQSFDWGIGKLHDVAFDAAGDRAACCSKSGKIVVWDVDR
jgi:WD40 repeat protein